MNEMSVCVTRSISNDCPEWSMPLPYTNTFSLKYFEGVRVHVSPIPSRSDQCNSLHAWPGFKLQSDLCHKCVSFQTTHSFNATRTLGKLDPLKFCSLSARNLEGIFWCWVLGKERVCKIEHWQIRSWCSVGISYHTRVCISSAQINTVMRREMGIFWPLKYTCISFKHLVWQIPCASAQMQMWMLGKRALLLYIRNTKDLSTVLQMSKWH